MYRLVERLDPYTLHDALGVPVATCSRQTGTTANRQLPSQILYDISYIHVESAERLYFCRKRNVADEVTDWGNMSGLFFEDIHVGQVFEAGPYTVSRDEIVDFATVFDPNPFHLEDAAAIAAGLPSLIASGFHTLSLSFRLFFGLHLWDDAIMPSPGLDTIRWLKPLCPGNTIGIRATIIETTLSRSKPDQGIIKARHETLALETGSLLLTAEAMHRLRTRAAGGIAYQAKHGAEALK
jgi:acyl dehydratase